MGVVMDNVTSKEGYVDADLEKGGVCDNLYSSEGLVIDNTMMKQLYSEASNGGLGSDNRSIKHEERVNPSNASSCGHDSENVKFMIVDRKVVEEKNGDFVENKVVKERPKAMSAKKPPKPPRPPRGLSLDSSDQKLIRELHELAKLKRARVERMKALKKAKEAKAVSSKNQLFATLLTVLFFLVVLFQGISSRTSSAASFRGSPISSGATEHGIISVQQFPITSSSNVNGLGSESPRLGEQVSSAGKSKQVHRALG